MSTSRHPVVEEELKLLDRVLQRLDEAPVSAGPSEESLIEELRQLRALLLSGTESKDRAALTEQWNRQTALLERMRAAGIRAHVDPESPYFAHMRLREEEGERDLCLGKATRVERGLRIVDWRNAPISRLFYRCRQGEDYEEEFGGRRHRGRVVARRVVTIRDRKLERVEAPEGVFARRPPGADRWRRVGRAASRLSGGEASALRAHTPGQGSRRRLGTEPGGAPRRADKHLPDIAGLLDPTQFELITRPGAGFVLIRGIAGSGKTTVALHRIAYLAFEDPGVDTDRTLVVVFSPALRAYVGHVLPALGLRRARIVTFEDWAAEQRRRVFRRLPRDVRLGSPSLVQRLKLHPALLVALERQVARDRGEPTVAQVLDDWASTLGSAERLEEAFASEDPGAFSSAELERIATWSRERSDELYAWLDGDTEIQAALDPEDDALLLRAWQLRVGPLPGRARRPLRYRHIAIDEAQDFAPIEIRVLLECLDSQRSLTLAGDAQQQLVSHGGFTSWSDFLERVGIDGVEVQTLRVSYRCSREIAEFSGALLGDLREADAPPEASRSGPPVELFEFTDHGACVGLLAEALEELALREPLASVAVLTPSAEISDLYHRGLARAQVPRVHRVDRQDFRFAPGVEVTEIDQAKGLEFDYVVLVDVGTESYPDTPPARRRLHVGATRAVHQLWLMSAGPVAIPLREALAGA